MLVTAARLTSLLNRALTLVKSVVRARFCEGVDAQYVQGGT